MPQDFVQQIERVRKRQQRGRVVVAICLALAALMVALLMAVTIDRILGIYESGSRAILTLLWAIGSLWIVRRWFAEITRPTVRQIDVARQVEHRQPELRDTVTSALQFSSQSADALGAGSESLRRAVVLGTARDVEDFHWNQLTPPRPLYKATLALATACVFATALTLSYLQPGILKTGLARLIHPLENAQWPWQTVEAIVPPSLTSLRLSVSPPRYTGLPKQPLEEPFRILSGSGLELTGGTNQPVVAVTLHCADAPAISAKLDSQGKKFSIPTEAWQVATSAPSTEHRDYWLMLTGSDGVPIRSEPSISLEIVPDFPPEIHFLKPTDDLTLVANARVQLAVESADELGTQEIQLMLHRAGESPADGEMVSVFQAQGLQPRGFTGATVSGAKRRERVEYVWDLAPLKLQPGSIVEVRARATDYQPAQADTVRPLRWTIVSREEMLRRIGSREASILDRLEHLRQRQRILEKRTEDRLHTDQPSVDRERAHAELFEQREISDALAGSPESLANVAAELLVDLHRNRLDRPETSARLGSLQHQLQQLATGALPTAERLLSQWARQDDRLAPEAQKKRLSDLLEQQSAIVAELDRALASFERYNTLQTLERELVFLRNDQRQLLDHCRTEIATKWLQDDRSIRPGTNPWPHETQRQRELATRLAKLVLRLDRTGQALEKDPAAERLIATARLARDIGVQATLRDAAERLSQNQLGRALSLQQKGTAQLQRLLDQLADPEVDRAERQIAALGEVQRQLQRLQKELQTIAEQNAAAQNLPAEERRQRLQRLERQREPLAKKMEEEARKLERLSAPRAAKAMQQAAQSLQQKQDKSGQNEEAKKHLDDAQKKLNQARRRQKVALAKLQMARLDVKLRSFISRQQAFVEEIVRLETIREATGQLSDPHQRSVLRLADNQAMLGAEVAEQAEALVSLPVFAHLLKQASHAMEKVADRLRQQQTGEQTQALANSALQQLKRIGDAVSQQREKLDDKAGQGGGGGKGEGPTGGGAEAEGLQLAIGQIKLLRTLQTELRDRTRLMEQQNAPAEQPRQQLADEQQKLVQLTGLLVPEPPLAPLDNLLPDFQQELEDSLQEDWQPTELLPENNLRSNQP